MEIKNLTCELDGCSGAYIVAWYLPRTRPWRRPRRVLRCFRHRMVRPCCGVAYRGRHV